MITKVLQSTINDWATSGSSKTAEARRLCANIIMTTLVSVDTSPEYWLNETKGVAQASEVIFFAYRDAVLNDADIAIIELQDLKSRISNELNSDASYPFILTAIQEVIIRAATAFLLLAEKRYITSKENTIRTLMMAVQLIDEYTALHSHRVALYAQLLANRAGIDFSLIHDGVKMHDVGKLIIPVDILKAPRSLTIDERMLIEQHPVHGAQIIRQIFTEDEQQDVKSMVDTAMHHHERWDGKGYPAGLAGEQIPFVARLISVADVFDAMTSHRVYSGAMSLDHAREEIVRNLGSQFDPELGAIFLEIPEEELLGVS